MVSKFSRFDTIPDRHGHLSTANTTLNIALVTNCYS